MDPDTALLVKAARAWDAERRYAGAPKGSAESRRIAREVMGILTATVTATGSADTSGQGRTAAPVTSDSASVVRPCPGLPTTTD